MNRLSYIGRGPVQLTTPSDHYLWLYSRRSACRLALSSRSSWPSNACSRRIYHPPCATWAPCPGQLLLSPAVAARCWSSPTHTRTIVDQLGALVRLARQVHVLPGCPRLLATRSDWILGGDGSRWPDIWDGRAVGMRVFAR